MKKKEYINLLEALKNDIKKNMSLMKVIVATQKSTIKYCQLIIHDDFKLSSCYTIEIKA